MPKIVKELKQNISITYRYQINFADITIHFYMKNIPIANGGEMNNGKGAIR